MENWKLFELKVTDFLNDYFNDTRFTFKSTGGSNSTSSDIAIYYDNKLLKSIEVKFCPAQSGQIVVLPIDGEFIFSSRSIYTNNPYSVEIISHMNQNFKKYNKVSSTGIPIDLDNSTFFNWIKYHYTHNKNSDFVIAGTLDKRKENIEYINFIEFPEMDKYFSIKCLYRKKRSGPNELPKKYENIFINKFSSVAYENNFKILNTYWEKPNKKNKFFIEVDKKFNKFEKYLDCGEFTSFLSYKNEVLNKYIYAVKKRSNTNNPNITYTLDLLYKKPNIYGLNNLIDYLNSIKH